MTNSTELSLGVDHSSLTVPKRFRCLTEPDLYTQWFGPDGATITVDEMQLALGGRLHLTIGFPANHLQIAVEGFYEVIDPPVQLVHRWQVQHEEVITTVRFDLEPVGSQTHLRIHHRSFVDPVDLEQNHGGWVDHLAKLGAVAHSIEAPQ